MRLPQADAPTRFSVAFADGSCEVLLGDQLCADDEQPQPQQQRHLHLVPPPADGGGSLPA